MSNKRITKFGFRRISEYIIQTSVSVICLNLALADNSDLGLNNSEYPSQPHPIILNCSILQTLTTARLRYAL